MQKTFEIMWRQVEITIPESISENPHVWVVSEQRVYAELWKRADRGKNKEANTIGSGGSILIGYEEGAFNAYYKVLAVAPSNSGKEVNV